MSVQTARIPFKALRKLMTKYNKKAKVLYEIYVHNAPQLSRVNECSYPWADLHFRWIKYEATAWCRLEIIVFRPKLPKLSYEWNESLYKTTRYYAMVVQWHHTTSPSWRLFTHLLYPMLSLKRSCSRMPWIRLRKSKHIRTKQVISIFTMKYSLIIDELLFFNLRKIISLHTGCIKLEWRMAQLRTGPYATCQNFWFLQL